MGVHALYTAATGMDAQLRNIDVIANNVANLDTGGFRKDRVNFADLFYRHQTLVGATGQGGAPRPTGINIGHGVRVQSTQKTFEPGGVVQTGNPLDLAIQKNGNVFFKILREDGSTAYTRAGSFTLDGDGSVRTPLGDYLDPPIQLPPDFTDVTITPGGLVQVSNGVDPIPAQVGQITLTRFINPAGLRPIGDNLFVASPASGEPQEVIPNEQGIGGLLQGAREGSNVNAITELIQLIQAQRAYEINSNIIETADEALQIANNLTG